MTSVEIADNKRIKLDLLAGESKSIYSMDDITISNVVIIVAMEAEARPLLTKLGLEKVSTLTEYATAPCMLYSGVHKECTVTVAVNGLCKSHGVDNVGTTPATLSTFIAINQLKPHIVINAGTAGGFKSKGACIGDPFIGTSFKNHDRRIAIPGFTEYGIGECKSHPCPNMIKHFNFKSGVVSTSNSLDYHETDMKLMIENDASIKEMEAASIAWVASLNNTPFMAIKVVTDIVDGDRPSHEEFLENLSTAAHSLQETVPKILDYIIGKKLTEL